ncbi:pyridoxal phosphate-dependent aminotransferase [bacterium]|nr:pyridoxal phosphate-dependent aminotransferase [bacterium]
MKISKLLTNLPASQTMAIDARAKALVAEGRDIVSFGPGEPDFDTPAPVKQAAKDALDAGLTKYSPTPGLPELRRAIAARYKREYGLDYDAADVIVTCGGKHALYEIFLTLLDPGDEVIIPAPYWVSYPPMVELAGGRPVTIPTTEATGFLATPSAIEAHLTPNTRAIVLCSPSNPTGAAYDAASLTAIAELAIKHDLIVIADEIYDKLVYDGFAFRCFATVHPDIRERTILVNGFSKTYAMTGWRLGWALGPRNVIGAMGNLQSQSTSNMPTFAQKAAVTALALPDETIQPMIDAFARRREMILNLIDDIPGLTCFRPQGAFYVFPNISAYFGKRAGDREIANSFHLSEYLLEEAEVAVVPGGAFGSDDNIRLSYATSEAQIEKGLARIAAALSRLT